MENKQNEFLEINLEQIWHSLLRRTWLIVLVGVLGAALAFCYAKFFITPVYASSIQLYVNNNYESPGFSSSQLTAAQDLADTYMVILESRSVLERVAKQTELGYNYGQLKSMVTATAINETEVFKVTVSSTNYKHATILVNSIAEVLPERIAAVVYGSTVSVVDYGVENPTPVGPNHMKYIVFGFCVGAFFVAILVVLVEMQNTSIYSEEYLTQCYTDVPLLAVIPGSGDHKTGYYKGYYETRPEQPADQITGGGKV